ncbi:MAG: hypothetical protein IPH13_21465 [Planctomycetes bacterium]|nr:hypothetical protein [Planctomycetota bacterium]MCC7169422.1 hypothetical protein [Planctomycetota bacterium]
MSSPRLLAFAWNLAFVACCAAQTAPQPPVAPPTPDDTKPATEQGTPAPEGEKVKAPKHPIEETIEPLAIKEGETAPTAAGLVERALAHMGGERLAATKSLEFERQSMHWGNRRLVYTERYRTQCKLTWPPVARVTELAFDTVKRKARPAMMFVQNGSDAFMQADLEVFSYPANEDAAKTRTATELGVPLLLSWLARSNATMTLDGRAIVRSFTPKTYLGIQRDDKKDEGFADYEPTTSSYVRVTVAMPADLTAYYGDELMLYFDEADGRLVRWRMVPLSRSVDRYGTEEVVFEVESYVPAVGADGQSTNVKFPGRVHAMLAGSAERVETLELKNVVIDSEQKDELFRRP